MKWDEIRMWLVLGANTVAMVGCFGMMVDDDQKRHRAWEAWATEHRCKVVSRIPGGFFENERTGWLCDDGVTYYR